MGEINYQLTDHESKMAWLTNVTYAKRHWNEAFVNERTSVLGRVYHFGVGLLELIPIVGRIISYVDRLFSEIFSESPEEKDAHSLERRLAELAPKQLLSLTVEMNSEIKREGTTYKGLACSHLEMGIPIETVLAQASQIFGQKVPQAIQQTIQGIIKEENYQHYCVSVSDAKIFLENVATDIDYQSRDLLASFQSTLKILSKPTRPLCSIEDLAKILSHCPNLIHLTLTEEQLTPPILNQIQNLKKLQSLKIWTSLSK